MQIPAFLEKGDDRLSLVKKGINFVLVTREVFNLLEKKKKKKRQIRVVQETIALFDYFADHDLSLLKSCTNKFRYEGLHPLKQGEQEKIEIHALKNTTIGLRIYGVIAEIEGKTCFVATNYDQNKKKERAKQHKLKKAALTFGELYDEK